MALGTIYEVWPSREAMASGQLLSLHAVMPVCSGFEWSGHISTFDSSFETRRLVTHVASCPHDRWFIVLCHVTGKQL